MITASANAESRGLDADAVRTRLDAYTALDVETIAASLPGPLRDRFSGSRFLERLALRHIRANGVSLCEPAQDAQDSYLFSGGPAAVVSLANRAGVQVFRERVLRVVERQDVEAIHARLGFDARSVASRAVPAAHAESRRPEALHLDEPVEILLDAIANEGARCWACWLSRQDPSRASRLRALTPLSLLRNSPGSPPDDSSDYQWYAELVGRELTALAAGGIS